MEEDQNYLKINMYIAMNRFKIVLGKENEFENVWKSRDTHLDGVKGFKNFNFAFFFRNYKLTFIYK